MNDSFFLSPLMAPAVAMAADTPQIETALASMVENSSSTFILRESQNEKYQTTVTTITACINPNDPAVSISLNSIVAPSSTSPILTYSSVCTPDFSQSGSLKMRRYDTDA